MIRIEEESRKSLSLQVHDQMGQELSALKIYLDLVDKSLPTESGEAKKRIAETKKILDGLMEKAHNISELLRPPALDEVGFIDTIGALIFQYKQMTGMHFVFQKPESGRIAVKVINHLGDEATKVFQGLAIARTEEANE